jgi:hypothetical protein
VPLVRLGRELDTHESAQQAAAASTSPPKGGRS